MLDQSSFHQVCFEVWNHNLEIALGCARFSVRVSIKDSFRVSFRVSIKVSIRVSIRVSPVEALPTDRGEAVSVLFSAWELPWFRRVPAGPSSPPDSARVSTVVGSLRVEAAANQSVQSVSSPAAPQATPSPGSAGACVQDTPTMFYSVVLTVCS